MPDPAQPTERNDSIMEDAEFTRSYEEHMRERAEANGKPDALTVADLLQEIGRLHMTVKVLEER